MMWESAIACARTLLTALPLAQAAQPADAGRGAGVPGVAGSAGSPAGYRVAERGRGLVVTGGTYRTTPRRRAATTACPTPATRTRMR